ncbi:helix-turn-helix domain-containing protein [Sphingomonas tabacisoli]|uniref:Helix-turn-helix domain-containing protein n=1 Tax=Sphingomonas tabacisoli TaxID=2249466 RepID=A0ABW4I3P5_9SPHN
MWLITHKRRALPISVIQARIWNVIGQREAHMQKREAWTEADVQALAAEESDSFERKSGRLLSDMGNFRDALAKAVSAFANSGGGTILLGVEDDGRLIGLPSLVGQQPVKEWFEHTIPNLVDYPLHDFRVHSVLRAEESQTLSDHTVIVIEIGDSALAPHQSKRDQKYYHRVGGTSKPAPHFYLELLRQRAVSATLEVQQIETRYMDTFELDGDFIIQLSLGFMIHNIGRVAAFKWNLGPRLLNHDMLEIEGWADRYMIGNSLPPNARNNGIRVDDTILPDCYMKEEQSICLRMKLDILGKSEIDQEIHNLIDSLKISYRLATETSPGKLVEVRPAEHIDVSLLCSRVAERIAQLRPA